MSPGEEDELESYLQRRALRSHRPLQEHLEPPPELDQIVLRKARLAVQSRHLRGAAPAALPRASAPRHHRPRWYGPASVAASVLVCLTLLVDLGGRALRNGEPAALQLHEEEAAESVASQTREPVLAKVVDEPTPSGYTGTYTGAPIFEVVIRTARLTARPVSVSDTPRSADPANR
jgi:hypothetical protein